MVRSIESEMAEVRAAYYEAQIEVAIDNIRYEHRLFGALTLRKEGEIVYIVGVNDNDEEAAILFSPNASEIAA